MTKILSFCVLGSLIAGGLTLPTTNNEKSLKESVTVEGIFEHLEQLYKIGLPNSRSVRNGYNESAEYVRSQLAPYCETTTQHFIVPVHQQLSTPTLSLVSPYETNFQHGVDYAGMRYGGSGSHNFSAPVTWVKRGCDAQDFYKFPKGHIALIQEGDCELVNKALLAETAGASAIFFYNQQSRTTLLTTRVRYVEWKFGDPLVKKPCLALSNLLGKLLLETPNVVVSLTADMLLTQDETYNVFCETPHGSGDNIIMAGAHLDSVPEGPGINDNGSGSSTLLEVAIQLFKTGLSNRIVNKIRFAWWGAEEIGLLGSRHYVREIKKKPTEFQKIALYMNFDMLASPNFTPQIHDGKQTYNTIPESVKKASTKVQNVFEEYFQKEGLPYELIGTYVGSDFVPFIEAGIPSSGMATGASAIKNEQQREKFGGLANAPFDPCYHFPCDSVLNINKEGLRQVSQSTSSTIEKLATMQNLRGYLYQ